ncbi:hypothetical protein QQP08_000631 [Theobroma cacao]|nr:hypothetical protein QQP08_000631 [Theobroma cacao]
MEPSIKKTITPTKPLDQTLRRPVTHMMTRKMEVESDLIFGGRGGGLVFGKVPQINCQALLLGESNPFE